MFILNSSSLFSGGNVNAFLRKWTAPTWVGVGLVVVLAFAIRLGFNIVFQGLSSGPDPAVGSDHVDYDRLARNLAQGQGYRLSPQEPLTAFRPPGTSLLLALLYRGLGYHYAVVRVAYSLLGAATCLLLYLYARTVVGPRWALGAALLLALDPGHAYYSMHFFSETPWTFFVMLALWLGERARADGRFSWLGLQGLSWGIAALIRPPALIIPFIQAGLFWLQAPRRTAAWARWLLPALVTVAVVAPWTLRNAQVFGRLVLISNHGGTTFYGANNEVVLTQPELAGRWIAPPLCPQYEQIRSAGDEVERDRKAKALGWAFVGSHLAEMPRLTGWKFIRLLHPWPATPNRIFNHAVAWSSGLLLPWWLAGVWRLLRRPIGPAKVPILACVIMLGFTTLMTYGDHRFRLSIEPVLVLLAILGLQGVASKRNPPAPGPASARPTVP